MKREGFLKILFTLLFALITFSSPATTLEKFVDLDFLKESSAPRMLTEGILISLPADLGEAIYLRTNLDGWRKNHYFKKSFYGIKYLILPYNYKQKRVLYNINVNGYWETDPGNSNKTEDKYGTEISYVEIPREVIYNYSLPIIEEAEGDNKLVRFQYYNPEAKEVTLVCSVDNMNLYSNIMTLNSDGYWTIDMHFSEGEYYYFFYVDGEKEVDMNNNNKHWHKRFGQLSSFTIE